MSLALTLLVAGALHVAPPAAQKSEPPPITARLLWIGPQEAHASSALIAPVPGSDSEVVFYFAEPGSSVQGASFDALASEPPTFSELPCPLHATLRSLGRWLMVLLAMVLVAALLGSVGASRRPLPLAAIAVRHPARPVPLVERLLVLACLWSPMLMLLGLLQAEREMLSSVLLCMAATGGVAAAAMLGSRRRLAARLRWAIEGRLGPLADDGPTIVKAEIEPKRLVPPPGVEGPTPWYRADLTVAAADGEAARVSLDGALVDDGAARALVRLAMGLPGGAAQLTVLGCATRAPADAASASPLERHAPTQARIATGSAGRVLLVVGAPAALARRLRTESLILSFALAASTLAAFVTLIS